jgi:hypothetical protein
MAPALRMTRSIKEKLRFFFANLLAYEAKVRFTQDTDAEHVVHI